MIAQKQNTDRCFHHLNEVVNRLQDFGNKGAYSKQPVQDKLIERKHYIHKIGEDLPEIRDWQSDATHRHRPR